MKSARLWVPVGIGLVLVVLALVGAVLASNALAAKGALERAIPLAGQVQDQILTGDSEAAAATAAELAVETAVARAKTDSAFWRSAEWVPVLGPNLQAVRVASAAADDLVTGALQPATTLSLDALKPAGGVIDLAALEELATVVDGAATTVDEVSAELDAIDRGALLGPVADGIAKLDGVLVTVQPLLEPARKTLQLLPAALGAEGPRNYLLLFQNNAESRGTGGNPAALVLLHVENGAISIAQQAGSGDFQNGRETPIVPLDPETAALYGDKIGRYMQDATLTPDFTETAEIITAFWAESFGTQVDGVVSFDPVALSYLLGATGPIVLPTGDTLTAENAVPLLLNEVYFRYEDREVQDAFFAAAAASIFSALTSGAGAGDTRTLIEALGRSVDEGRLMFAPNDAAEAELIAGTRIAGRLPADDSEHNVIGVYVDDITEGKLDYYLQMDIQAQANCPVGRAQQLSTSVSLVNTLDPAAVDDLARYISPGRFFPKGEISTDLVVYGPVHSTYVAARVDGAPVGAQPLTHLGRPAVKINVRNVPGAAHTVVVDFAGAAGADATSPGPLEVWHTPMVRPVGLTLAGDCAD